VQPTQGFSWLQAPAGRALVCRALAPFAAHLFTTRAWLLGLPDAGPGPGAWREVAEALGVGPGEIVRARQVHGAAVVVRRARNGPSGKAGGSPSSLTALPEADILVSDDSSVCLAIQTADCVPLLLADRRTGAVGAVHAGWRGLAARAPQVAVEAMASEFGSRPADLVAAIGPSIGASRYEVGVDVRTRFERAGFHDGQLSRWFSDGRRTGHWWFDGWQSSRDLLAASGVPGGQIHVAGMCTATHADLFCSYRRDGKGTGRMAAAIRARSESQRQRF
jgi:YfiH family protein